MVHDLGYHHVLKDNGAILKTTKGLVKLLYSLIKLVETLFI